MLDQSSAPLMALWAYAGAQRLAMDNRQKLSLSIRARGFVWVTTLEGILIEDLVFIEGLKAKRLFGVLRLG